MPFAKPQILVPILHPGVSLEALERILSSEQIRLVMRLDGATSVSALVPLLGRSLSEVIEDVQELAMQGVLQLYQRHTPQNRLTRVIWPPTTEEWNDLPGLAEEVSPKSTDTEPEVYTISSMELMAFPASPNTNVSSAQAEDPGESTNPEHEPVNHSPVSHLSIAPDLNNMDVTIVKGFNFAEYLATQAAAAKERSGASQLAVPPQDKP